MLAQNILTILALAFTVSSSPLIARQIKSSGNDGEGNQNVGNGGQNAGNGASNTGTINGDYTVEQATVTCGNAQLNCCNKVSKKGDTTNAGLLGAVFGSGDLDVQCSPLNIPIIGSAYRPCPPSMWGSNNADCCYLLRAVQVPINKACDAKAACCQGKTSQVFGTRINTPTGHLLMWC